MNIPTSNVPQQEWQYILFLCSCFIFVTLIALFEAESWFWVCVALGSAAGIYGLWSLLVDRRLIRLPAVLSGSFLVGYFVGHVLYLVAELFLPESRMPDWFSQSYGDVSISSKTIAAVVVIFSSLFLRVIGWFTPGLFKTIDSNTGASRFDMIVILAVLGVVLTAYWSGQLGYRGIQTGMDGHVPLIGTLAAAMLVPLAPTAFYFGVVSHGLRRMVCFVVFLLAELLIVPIGRREVFFSIVLVALFAAGANRFDSPLSRRSRRLVRVGFLITGLIAVPAIVGNYAFREYAESIGPENARGMGSYEMVSGTVRLFVDDPSQVVAALVTNVGPRAGSLLPYFGDQIVRHQPLHGDVVTFGLQMVIPSAVWPQKKLLLDETQGQPEALIHPMLGLPVFDGPNTVLTEGYADFGLIGSLGYAVVVAALYTAFGYFAARQRSRVTILMTYGALLFSLMSFEKSLGGYFAELRDIGLMFIFLTGITLVYRTFMFRSRFQSAMGTKTHVMDGL